MRNAWPCLLIAAALVGGGLLASDASAQPAAARAATRVAVCDIVEVFDNYQRAKDLTQKLSAESQRIKAENDQREQAIKREQAKLENLTEGSPAYEEVVNKIQRLTIDRKVWLEFMTAKNMREHHRLTLEMYNEIVAQVGMVAREMGFQLVLQRDRSKINSKNTPDLIRQIAARKTIYAAPEIDLTEIVLGRLNMAYRAKKTP